jgi:hypothetical protein
MDFGASGADDMIGGTKDFLSALFRYRFGVRNTAAAEPVLYIAASIIGSLKAQRFATKKRYGFGFDFTQTAGRRFVVREISVVGVKNYVSQFMEKRLVWELSKRANCDLTLAGKALNISVRVIEWNTLNTQRLNRSVCVPLRDRNWLKFSPSVWAKTNQRAL